MCVPARQKEEAESSANDLLAEVKHPLLNDPSALTAGGGMEKLMQLPKVEGTADASAAAPAQSSEAPKPERRKSFMQMLSYVSSARHPFQAVFGAP